MKFLVRTFVAWLPLAVAITGLCLLVYATVQQNYRQSLNDPQIQMAEDTAAALDRGVSYQELVAKSQIDIAHSLAPWLAIYDSEKKPLASSGILDGEAPLPPAGVFEAAQTSQSPKGGGPIGENRISWQPRLGVRSAIVVVWVPETKQFVVAGRSMREVEDREGRLSAFVFLAWVVLLGATLIGKGITRYVIQVLKEA